ncbi:MAG TPA: hypothetical protein ENH59_09685 [Bacteroidetes bacterium]|nr:hypothetical protein [Bacteroidota bacterium]
MRTVICKYFLLLTVLFFLSVISCTGQTEREKRKVISPPVAERIFFGGGFGLQFGTITNIELSPVVGIWLLPRLAVAAGPKWQYYKDPMGKTSIYGGRSFSRFMFVRDFNSLIPLGINFGLFAHAEYEALSLEHDFWTGYPTGGPRIWQHTALLGLGFSQPIGVKSSFNISFLWAITGTEYQLYDNPEIRIDFLF